MLLDLVQLYVHDLVEYEHAIPRDVHVLLLNHYNYGKIVAFYTLIQERIVNRHERSSIADCVEKVKRERRQRISIVGKAYYVKT